MSVGPLRGFVTAGAVAPYAAVQERSRTQTLADGTVISAKFPSEKIYRDSQGRIRNERAVCEKGGEEQANTYAMIRDPVAGYAYILDGNTHTAYRYKEQVRQRGTPPPTPEEYAAVLGIPRLAPGPQFPTTTESLGSQTMEGVYVEGTRSTTTIPAGQQDNDRPFKIERDTWMSPVLHVVILSRESDPRMGEETTRLTNIELSEQRLSLFQPPADYTITDVSTAVTVMAGARP